MLAGCSPVVSDNDPIAARLVDGELQITVCTPWTLTSVLVEARTAGFVTQSEKVWVAEGRSEISGGDVLSSDAPPSGLVASAWGEPHLAPDSDLTIALVGENDETLEASLVVPMSGFPDEEWLQTDGSVTEAAC